MFGTNVGTMVDEQPGQGVGAAEAPKSEYHRRRSRQRQWRRLRVLPVRADVRVARLNRFQAPILALSADGSSDHSWLRTRPAGAVVPIPEVYDNKTCVY